MVNEDNNLLIIVSLFISSFYSSTVILREVLFFNLHKKKVFNPFLKNIILLETVKLPQKKLIKLHFFVRREPEKDFR